MTKKDSEEPTMEEILASIRRIIAEEGDDAKSADAGPAVNEAAAEGTEADILELTEVVQDSPPEVAGPGEEVMDLNEPVDDIQEAAEAFAENDMETPAQSLAKELPGGVDDGEVDLEADIPLTDADFADGPLSGDDREDALLADAVDPADPKDAIMSDQYANQVSDSFARLSDLLVAGYAGSDKTLEGMVREMLKPMLKEWLDKNLPAVVERVVAREVARLARTKRP
jgi:cell pole-organizing protein PopZ